MSYHERVGLVNYAKRLLRGVERGLTRKLQELTSYPGDASKSRRLKEDKEYRDEVIGDIRRAREARKGITHD